MAEHVPIDRGVEVLSRTACLELLEEVPIGRMGFVLGGRVQMLPVNHALLDGDVVFKSTVGPKQAAAVRHDVVTFQVDDWTPDRTGWSVQIIGHAEVVDGDLDLERIAALGVEPWAEPESRPVWIRVRAEEVTGRRINAST